MANDWLNQNVLGKGGGPELTPYGPHQCDADLIVFVCFDCNILYKFSTANAREAVERAFPKFRRYGSGNGNTLPNTGYGVLLLPTALKAESHVFVPNPKYDNWSLSQRAVMVVRDHYARQGYQVAGQVSIPADIAGTDIYVFTTTDKIKVQVKSRGPKKGFLHLFIQTHESNPENIYQ